MNAVIICSEALSEKIVPFLEKKNNINIVGKTNDGTVGLDLILNKHPDIIIVSLILKTFDGIELLKKLKTKRAIGNKKSPKCIVLVEHSSEFTLTRLKPFPLDYILNYPFELNVLYDRIIDLFKYEENYNDFPMEHLFLLDGLLTELFLKSSLDGYKFIKNALILSINDKDYLNSVTKLLYPEIAVLHNKKKSSIERSIRNAIDIAWCSDDAKKKMIEYKIIKDYNSKRPTNKRFIMALYDIYKYKISKN